MTEEEINELRAILRAQAETEFSFERLFVGDEDAVYADFHGYAVTAHEMKVFHLDRETVSRSAVALMYYEDMCELCTPSLTEGRTHELIMKAKVIAPVEQFYGQKNAFDGCLFHFAWYLWFAKTFADVPMRDAYAFYRKNEAASLHLMQFADEDSEEK